MIQNDEQLQRAREAVASLEHSVAILQKDQGRLHPDRYALMAAPILEDLLLLRQQIDDYLGVSDTVRATSAVLRATRVEG